MQFFEAIAQFGGIEPAKNYAKYRCSESSISWTNSAEVIFNFSCMPELSPTFRGLIIDKESAVDKWINAYFGDYLTRASVRRSNPPQTAHDHALDKIIKGRLSNISNQDLETIKWAHRLSMSAENIFGLILEEYLATRLYNLGWHCAWGSVVKAVDFVCEDGRLLQVKSRNNTENSSSSKIRSGTAIQKWWRFNASNGMTNWQELNSIVGSQLTEDDFQNFVENLIRENPLALAVESNNTLIRFI